MPTLSPRVAELFLRYSIAAVFLWHGVPKAIDPAAAVDKFVGFGLPGVLGPVIGVTEVVASILLVIGFQVRWAALLLAAIILGAIVTVQVPSGVTSGLERDLLILAGLGVVFALGQRDTAAELDE